MRHSYSILQDFWLLSSYFQFIFPFMLHSGKFLLPSRLLTFCPSVYIMLLNPSMTLLIIIIIFFLFRSSTWLVSHLFCHIYIFLCPEEIFKFVFILRVYVFTILVFRLLAGLLLLWVDSEASLFCFLFLWSLFIWAVHHLLSLKAFILFER